MDKCCLLHVPLDGSISYVLLHFFYDCLSTILKTRIFLTKHYTKFTHPDTQVSEQLSSFPY